MRLTPSNAKLTLSGSPRSLTSWQHSVDMRPFRPVIPIPIHEKSLMKFAALILVLRLLAMLAACAE